MIKNDEFNKFATKHVGISSTTIDSYSSYIKNMTRSVIEERPAHFREVDVFSRLIMDRIIFLGTEVNETVANIIVAQLLFLESVDAEKDILLYINSPGGSVYAGLGIYDTMQYVTPEISTICTGLAASMGAVLLAGGTTKKRSALPHARVMIHQPLGGTKGQTTEVEIYFKEMKKIKEDINNILSKHTGKSPDQIEKDGDRDYWLKAEDAKEYGLIDEVVTRNKV